MTGPLAALRARRYRVRVEPIAQVGPRVRRELELTPRCVACGTGSHLWVQSGRGRTPRIACESCARVGTRA